MGDPVERIVSLVSGRRPAKGMSCKLIAIDGPGGAGKSTLAVALAARLGDAPIVPTDDFNTGNPGVQWRPRLLEQVLLRLVDGGAARYQRYDWAAGRLAEWCEIPAAEHLIIEGVYSSRAEFRRYLALTVWVSTAREERLRRGLERDGQDARARWLAWMAEEDAYVAAERPEERADVVVSGMR